MASAKPGSERDVQQRAIIWLRKEGWHVTNTSSARAQARGLRGVPDLLCHYHGMTVYVEVKGFDKAELRPTQKAWWVKIDPHLSNTLRFLFVNNMNFEGWKASMRRIKDDCDIRRTSAGRQDDAH